MDNVTIDNTKYIEFKHILSGCRTISDAHFFAELFLKHNPNMRTIVYSMINGKRYDPILDFRTMKSLTVYMSECDGHEEIDKRTNDTTQMQTFIRATKDKTLQHNDQIFEFETINHNITTKNCPHCDHPCYSCIDTTYIICGYHDTHTGYDWKGCGRDWCFKCGRCLCKTWDSNLLFSPLNRYHDKDCCHKHAIEHNKQYPNEYCQCSSEYVRR